MPPKRRNVQKGSATAKTSSKGSKAPKKPAPATAQEEDNPGQRRRLPPRRAAPHRDHRPEVDGAGRQDDVPPHANEQDQIRKPRTQPAASQRKNKPKAKTANEQVDASPAPSEDENNDQNDDQPRKRKKQPARRRPSPVSGEESPNDEQVRKLGTRRKRGREESQKRNNSQQQTRPEDSKPPKRRRRDEASSREGSAGSNASQDNGWPDVDVLAQTSIDVDDFQYEDRDATLRIEIQVHRDPNELQSRIGYRARLSLMQQNEDGSKKKRANAFRQVGYIHSWRISKTTTSCPQVPNVWRRELLDVTASETEEFRRETAYCLQALFFKKGTAKQVVRERRDELEGNSLLFIQMIYIFQDFQRRGLLTHALAGFHRALGQLPEWYAFKGSIVLIPARPESDKGRSFGQMTEEEVEDLLTHVYERHGYQVWAPQSKVSDNNIVVMGRTIP